MAPARHLGQRAGRGGGVEVEVRPGDAVDAGDRLAVTDQGQGESVR